jgi:hypothetical protein
MEAADASEIGKVLSLTPTQNCTIKPVLEPEDGRSIRMGPG